MPAPSDRLALIVLALLPSLAQAAPRALGFGDAVRRAMAQNPTAKIAAEEITRARALLEETRSQSLPTLAAGGTYTRLDHDRKLGSELLLGANQLYGDLLLAVPLVQARGWVQWKHAKENIDVAALSAEDARRLVAISAARTYLGIIAQKRVVEVTVRAEAAARAHYDFAHQRFAAGYGSRLDEVRAAQEVAIDRSQREAAEAQLVRLQEALGVLVAADGPADAAEDAPDLGAPPSDQTQALDEAHSLRTDLKLDEKKLDLAKRVSRDTWADYMPSLLGTFMPFLQNPATPTVPQAGWQAQLALVWPIYDGGLRYGLAKERRALVSEAALQLEGTARQVAAEVRTAEEEVRHFEAALSEAREAAKNAAAAQELTALGYRAGASTNIEVIDAERTARDAATAVAVAEDAWRQALLDLLIGSGRFPAKN
jgi:outer membrane protein TolC